MTAEPHKFLVESDGNEAAMVRRMVASARQNARHSLDALRDRLDEPGDRARLIGIESDLGVLHTYLVAALDARTAELTDEALGNEPE